MINVMPFRLPRILVLRTVYVYEKAIGALGLLFEPRAPRVVLRRNTGLTCTDSYLLSRALLAS